MPKSEVKKRGGNNFMKSRGYMTVAEIANTFGIPRQTIYTWIRSERVGTVRFGSRLFIHRSSLKALMPKEIFDAAVGKKMAHAG